MLKPPLPKNEQERLADLHRLEILDTPPEERFDRITRLAVRLLHVPMALVSLVDANRQWFKSCQGLSATQTDRDVSFCGYTILKERTLVIEDALKDERFADNPLVTGPPHIRFYAGHPLHGPQGQKVGTLCLLDSRPRRFGAERIRDLQDLAALVESELNATQLSLLMESLADGILIFDEQGSIESVNPASERMFAYLPGSLTGVGVSELIPEFFPRQRDATGNDRLLNLQLEKKGVRLELAGKRRNGETFPLELSLGEMRWGGRCRYIGVVHDLTERKLIEERLRLQATALESAANGIVITDHQGTIQWVNPAYSQLTGSSAAEAIGQKAWYLKPLPDGSLPHPAIWKTVSAGQVWHGELANRSKDGSCYIEEMTITPVVDATGVISHCVAIKQDVTARKQAEEQLLETVRQLEEQYRVAETARSEARAIFDATSEAMVLLSPEGEFLALNRSFEEFFAFKAEELLGQQFFKRFADVERIFADTSPFRTGLAASAEDPERVLHAELQQVWPVQRELQLYSPPVRNAEGEFVGRLYAFRDVTRDREIDRMKSEFVSLVSHELRTPLTSITGYLEMVLDGDAGELAEEQRDYLEIVKRNTDRLACLVTDLLDVSRIEAGKIELKLLPQDLPALIKTAVESMQPMCQAKQQQLAVQVAATLPPVQGDANRIIQILTNFISNACKYTPEQGSISVVARLAEGETVVEVRDTGIGLSAADQQQLFSKFFRADNSTTRQVGGTGLGLWITRSLVELHGGRIEVESSPGKGSTFRFTLPLA